MSRYFSKRDLIRAMNDARSGIGCRFKIRIENHPPNRPVAPAPYTAADTPPQGSSDIVIYGTGFFRETKDNTSPEDSGEIRARRGLLNCHIRYEESFRQAYSVEIGGQKGVWEVIGVSADIPRVSLNVYVQARQ